jgi:hypothetical protein
MAVMTSDAGVRRMVPAIQSTWLAEFPSYVIYTDSKSDRKQHLQPCCGSLTSLGDTLGFAQQKMEHTYHELRDRFPKKDWYIYSDDDVYWSIEGLAAHLQLLSKNGFDPRVRAIVSGGGGYPRWNKELVGGCFVVLSRKALELAADFDTIQRAKDLISRLARNSHKGSHRLPTGAYGVPYNNDHLLMKIWAIARQKGNEVKVFLNPTGFMYNRDKLPVDGLLGALPLPKFRAAQSNSSTVGWTPQWWCAAISLFRVFAAIHHVSRDDILVIHQAHIDANRWRKNDVAVQITWPGLDQIEKISNQPKPLERCFCGPIKFPSVVELMRLGVPPKLHGIVKCHQSRAGTQVSNNSSFLQDD